EYAGDAILFESKVNSWSVRSRLSTWGAKAINGIGLLAMIVLSGRETRRYDRSGPRFLGGHFLNLHYLNVLLLGLMLLVLGGAILENARASKRAYQAAKSQTS